MVVLSLILVCRILCGKCETFVTGIQVNLLSFVILISSCVLSNATSTSIHLSATESIILSTEFHLISVLIDTFSLFSGKLKTT